MKPPTKVTVLLGRAGEIAPGAAPQPGRSRSRGEELLRMCGSMALEGLKG